MIQQVARHLTYKVFSLNLANMNVTELARRLRVTPQELLAKLPELGFDIGARAIKVDNRVADKIYKKWLENERKERLRAQLVQKEGAGDEDKTEAEKKSVELPPVITVRDFAGRLSIPVTGVIQQLMKAGILASQNERIDYTTAAIIAEELGFEPSAESKEEKELEKFEEGENKLKGILAKENPDDLESRPPVIVVMGHVDHGKTKTLDAIRATNIVDDESGGITQHIGAYQVEKKDKKITFIDTPGHEAFTVMRSRGAKVADIAILVVAADDGVQPQTKEAIDIIKAAGLPFIVAMNKMDKPDADPNRVMGQLAEVNVTVEEWGGKIPMAKISALNGEGIDDLLDLVLLVAEVEKDQIRANPKTRAVGTIIESNVDKGEGPVATVIVQNGTLHKNDYLGIEGASYGRVRAMKDWTGEQLKEAEPGTPVKILGFKTAPAVGDIVQIPKSPKDLVQRKAKTSHQVTESFTASRAVKKEEDKDEAEKKYLHIVLKADVLGSLEALLGMIEKIEHELVGVKVIQKGLGNVTETDLERADASRPSVVYGFNVQIPSGIASEAREKEIDILKFSVIYDLYNDIIDRLNTLLPQETVVNELGKAEVAAIFRTESDKMIVGVKVKEGKLIPDAKLRIFRDGEIMDEGRIESLKSGQSAVKEVAGGQEAGLSFSGKFKLEEGDVLEAYTEESKARKIESFTK